MRSKAIPHIITAILLFTVTSVLHAQDYSVRHYAGIDIKTNGFGLQYGQARFTPNSDWHKIISTGISTLKHPKEIKIHNPRASNPTPYVFGKLNKVFLVHVTPGIRYDAIPRHKNNHLGLTFLMSIGPEIAALKPIYLRINYNNQTNDGVFIANERYNQEVHTDQSMIEGYSRSKFGWSELTYQLGVQVNPAVQVEWGKDQINSKTIVIGSRFDIFGKNLPIMANNQQSQAFGAFYIQFLWGFIKL
jgi:hypothetical protein